VGDDPRYSPSFQPKPAAYHGLLEVDPATGTVMRISLEAESAPKEGVERASMAVEYGPVKVGDRILVCPIRSVSILVARAEIHMTGAIQPVNRLLLNDVQFTNYWGFGPESKILTQALPPPASPQQGNTAGTLSDSAKDA